MFAEHEDHAMVEEDHDELSKKRAMQSLMSQLDMQDQEKSAAAGGPDALTDAEAGGMGEGGMTNLMYMPRKRPKSKSGGGGGMGGMMGGGGMGGMDMSSIMGMFGG